MSFKWDDGNLKERAGSLLFALGIINVVALIAFLILSLVKVENTCKSNGLTHVSDNLFEGTVTCAKKENLIIKKIDWK